MVEAGAFNIAGCPKETVACASLIRIDGKIENRLHGTRQMTWGVPGIRHHLGTTTDEEIAEVGRQ